LFIDVCNRGVVIFKVKTKTVRYSGFSNDFSRFFDNLFRDKNLHTKAAHYKFTKKPGSFDKGYLKINDWLNDLCFYYIQKHKQIAKEDEKEFSTLIQAHREKIEALSPSEYKEGLLKALTDIN